MINDDRNGTEYSCVTVSRTVSQPTQANIVDESDPTILYVAGEYQYMYTAIFNSIVVKYIYKYAYACVMRP